MQNRVFTILLFLLPLSGFAQRYEPSASDVSPTRTEHYLSLFLKTDLAFTAPSDDILAFIDKLEKKKHTFSSERDFLRHLFVKTHQKILKRYTENCTFAAMVNNGSYNCLTGTTLFALLLDHFKIDYRVVETNYHIFLVAKTNGGNVLFEATDPVNGFVDSPSEIDHRITVYRENKLQNRDNVKTYYHYQFDIYKTVDLDELLGLTYYNLSIDAYNGQEFQASINYLDSAIKLYQSPRVEEFSKIILLTVSAKDIKKSEKETCLQKIQSLRNKMPGLASSSISNH